MTCKLLLTLLLALRHRSLLPSLGMAMTRVRTTMVKAASSSWVRLVAASSNGNGSAHTRRRDEGLRSPTQGVTDRAGRLRRAVLRHTVATSIAPGQRGSTVDEMVKMIKAEHRAK